jgi:DNA-directed RNA polymerase specialized sigma24 family protein
MADDNTQKLKKVTEKASQIDALKKNVKSLQGDLDTAVLDAKTSGAKYREIATSAGRSVAWVQATLNRLGYQGTRKKKAATAA